MGALAQRDPSALDVRDVDSGLGAAPPPAALHSDGLAIAPEVRAQFILGSLDPARPKGSD